MNIINEALRTWRHAGLQCAIRRHRDGPLCGYVQIPEGHPWHGERDLWLGDHEISWSDRDSLGDWWIGIDWYPMRHQMQAAGLSVGPWDLLASVAEFARRHGPSEQDAVSAVIGLANRAREVADGQS